MPPSREDNGGMEQSLLLPIGNIGESTKEAAPTQEQEPPATRRTVPPSGATAGATADQPVNHLCVGQS